MTKIIAIDNTGQKHITYKGNGSKYCRDNKINLDWSDLTSFTGMVMDGGLFFGCKECEGVGVIPKDEFTIKTKQEHNKQSTAILGVYYTKCEDHTHINNIIQQQ